MLFDPQQLIELCHTLSATTGTCLEMTNPNGYGQVGNRRTSVSSELPSRQMVAAGYVTTFVLGIYGFFSGGYVALLTAACVGFSGMTFLEAVAATKILNIFSSLVATAIFAREGIINWEAGIVLGVASFVGGVVGAVVAQRMSNVWLRRVFLTVVVSLAIKTLVVDVAWVTP